MFCITTVYCFVTVGTVYYKERICGGGLQYMDKGMGQGIMKILFEPGFPACIQVVTRADTAQVPRFEKIRLSRSGYSSMGKLSMKLPSWIFFAFLWVSQ